MFDKKAYDRKYASEHRAEANARTRKYEHKHREEANVRKRKYTRKLKYDVLMHYSSTNPLSCSRCGIDDIDVLCLDHINGGGKRQLKELGLTSGTAWYQWIRTNNYPEGFQVLCANCNLKKSIREKC